MKVLIDADGCPVVDAAIQLCKTCGTCCLLLCDTSHNLYRDGAETLIFDKGVDSVDYALVNRLSAGDIVITQDYGLGSMCLARHARVLHQDGWEYTEDNIESLLLARHEARKLRSAGKHMKNPKKRTSKQNASFEAALKKLLQSSVQG